MSKPQRAAKREKRVARKLAPTLSDLFAGDGEKAGDVAFNPNYDPAGSLPVDAISLGALAASLNIPVARLFPILKAGYLVVHPTQHPAELTGRTIICLPPQLAILWLRSWFQPARAKLLFSLADLADLLGMSPREVTKLAAAADLPVVFDPGLDGLVFSTWAARRLLQIQANGGEVDVFSQRFDRQALLWMLLEDNPEKLGKPPLFEERLEEEIARVAKLPDDVRAARAIGLWEAWQDAVRLAEAEASMLQASHPGKLAKVRLQAARLTPKFSRLRDVV